MRFHFLSTTNCCKVLKNIDYLKSYKETEENGIKTKLIIELNTNKKKLLRKKDLIKLKMLNISKIKELKK